jgi:hypothetical protein
VCVCFGSVQATSDVEARPKGGFLNVRDSPTHKTSLWDYPQSKLMGKDKAYGKGAYADVPFLFGTIDRQVGCTVVLVRVGCV